MRSTPVVLILLFVALPAPSGAGEPTTGAPAQSHCQVNCRDTADGVAQETVDDEVDVQEITAKLDRLNASIEQLRAAGLDAEARLAQATADQLCRRLLTQQAAELRRLNARLAAFTANRIQPAPQFVIKVQIVEFNRTACKKLGFTPADNVEFVDPAGIEGHLKALETENLAKVLAEPSLLVSAGRPASFTNGGEFPIPTVRPDKSVQVTQQTFGTQIDALVIKIDDEHVRLEIRPRISTLVPQLGIKVAGIPVPGLRVQAVDTGFDMQLGKTAVIAGEVQQRVTLKKADDDALIKTTSDRHEVVTLFLVTPRLVEPNKTATLPTGSPDTETK